MAPLLMRCSASIIIARSEETESLARAIADVRLVRGVEALGVSASVVGRNFFAAAADAGSADGEAPEDG